MGYTLDFLQLSLNCMDEHYNKVNKADAIGVSVLHKA